MSLGVVVPWPARSVGLAAVVFEAHEAEERRLRIRTDAVVEAQLTRELEPESAAAALFGPPLVTVTDVLMTPVPARQPELMNIGSERRIVVGSTGRLITHKPRVQVGPVVSVRECHPDDGGLAIWYQSSSAAAALRSLGRSDASPKCPVR
jgi:hypothetical protein